MKEKYIHKCSKNVLSVPKEVGRVKRKKMEEEILSVGEVSV